ncbi:transposase, partial [Natrinema hispanicum]
RVEDRIEKHSEDVQLKQSILEETYNNRTGVERTNDAVKDCGLGHVRARGRVHARTEVFVALCLRIVIAITNYERGHDPGREKLKL